jgi:hypothetical protein
LPSDATYDKTSGVSFVCDLNDNIAAPWPSKSYALASTCNKSMAQMLNLLFSMESIFAYKVLLPLFTARTPLFFYWFLLGLYGIAAAKLPQLPTATSSQSGKGLGPILLYQNKSVFLICAARHVLTQLN